MNKKALLCILLLSLFTTLNFTYAYYSTTKTVKNDFKTISYKLKLNSSGGKYISTQIIVANNSITLPTPIKNGYTFIGYSNSNGGSVNYSTDINNIKSINNKEIYAVYNKNTYSINYNLNGGSISGQKTSYNVEQSFTLPIPYKTGYTFIGWTGSNGNTKQTSVTVPKGTTGNLSYTANWQINTFVIDVNPIIHNVAYNSGLSGFTFSVWLDGTLVADHVTDYYNSSVPYGTRMRVYVYDRDGYSVTSFRDNTWTVTSSFNINPTWYDNIPPTITDFQVTNLGYFNPSLGAKAGWNIYIYINAYDNGTGIQKFQTWLTPYGNGSGSGRKDGQERTLENVLYLNTSQGRTFCAYAIDNAGNESEKCATIKVN